RVLERAETAVTTSLPGRRNSSCRSMSFSRPAPTVPRPATPSLSVFRLFAMPALNSRVTELLFHTSDQIIVPQIGDIPRHVFAFECEGVDRYLAGLLAR